MVHLWYYMSTMAYYDGDFNVQFQIADDPDSRRLRDV